MPPFSLFQRVVAPPGLVRYPPVLRPGRSAAFWPIYTSVRIRTFSWPKTRKTSQLGSQRPELRSRKIVIMERDSKLYLTQSVERDPSRNVLTACQAGATRGAAQRNKHTPGWAPLVKQKCDTRGRTDKLSRTHPIDLSRPPRCFKLHLALSYTSSQPHRMRSE
jgi:hypothetical protein